MVGSTLIMLVDETEGTGGHLLGGLDFKGWGLDSFMPASSRSEPAWA